MWFRVVQLWRIGWEVHNKTRSGPISWSDYFTLLSVYGPHLINGLWKQCGNGTITAKQKVVTEKKHHLPNAVFKRKPKNVAQRYASSESRNTEYTSNEIKTIRHVVLFRIGTKMSNIREGQPIRPIPNQFALRGTDCYWTISIFVVSDTTSALLPNARFRCLGTLWLILVSFSPHNSCLTVHINRNHFQIDDQSTPAA